VFLPARDRRLASDADARAVQLANFQRHPPALHTHERLGFSGNSFSLATIRQSSATDSAFNFRVMLLRWTFTVVSVIPISPAICLFSRPSTTCIRIALTRRQFFESRPERAQHLFIFAPRPIVSEPIVDCIQKLRVLETKCGPAGGPDTRIFSPLSAVSGVYKSTTCSVLPTPSQAHQGTILAHSICARHIPGTPRQTSCSW